MIVNDTNAPVAQEATGEQTMRRHPQYGPGNPDATYVPHAYAEHQQDIGEITINYAVAGAPENPAIVLIPGQVCSWWSYERSMALLSEYFQVYAVDIRGQGRSSRTPGRYTFDNVGNDVVRFITYVVRRPVIVSGHSGGAIVSAWLSAYAPPGMVRGTCYEDPPLFSCEHTPAVGPSLRQISEGPSCTVWELFVLLSRHLGDQWLVGDWSGFAAATEGGEEPPQAIKEYDPEWARAFVEGTVSASCDHFQMLSRVRCPVLLTHHGPVEEVAVINGVETIKRALSGEQAQAVQDRVTAAGQPITCRHFPDMPHSMHGKDPQLFADVIREWAASLPTEADVRAQGVFAQT